MSVDDNFIKWFSSPNIGGLSELIKIIGDPVYRPVPEPPIYDVPISGRDGWV